MPFALRFLVAAVTAALTWNGEASSATRLSQGRASTPVLLPTAGGFLASYVLDAGEVHMQRLACHAGEWDGPPARLPSF